MLLQVQLEEGDIDEDEYAEREAELLARMREIKARKRAESSRRPPMSCQPRPTSRRGGGWSSKRPSTSELAGLCLRRAARASGRRAQRHRRAPGAVDCRGRARGRGIRRPERGFRRAAAQRARPRHELARTAGRGASGSQLPPARRQRGQCAAGVRHGVSRRRPAYANSCTKQASVFAERLEAVRGRAEWVVALHLLREPDADVSHAGPARPSGRCAARSNRAHLAEPTCCAAAWRSCSATRRAACRARRLRKCCRACDG